MYSVPGLLSIYPPVQYLVLVRALLLLSFHIRPVAALHHPTFPAILILIRYSLPAIFQVLKDCNRPVWAGVCISHQSSFEPWTTVHSLQSIFHTVDQWPHS